MNTTLDLQGIGMTSMRTRKRLIGRLKESGIADTAVLDAMLNTPRHIFVDEALAHRAYEDTALPIGYHQTLSQPYIVAKMSELLCADGRPERVLEVGTGSGYQSAILAHLVEHVYTVERIEPLLRKALGRFERLGLENLQAALSDGAWGWPEKGPFDAIIVTAAPEEVPQELLNQVKVGGKLVIPVGRDGQQKLRVLKRSSRGFEEQVVEAVRFVPLLPGVVR